MAQHRSLARTRHKSVWGYTYQWIFWILQKTEAHTNLFLALKILTLWSLSLCLLPLIISCYLGIFTFRLTIRTLFRYFYPHLRIVDRFSLRTLLHSRTKPADVILALRFIGISDIKWIRRCVQENLLDKRDSHGSLVFPELRSILTTKWTVPVWKEDPDFSVDRHVVCTRTGDQAFNVEKYVTNLNGRYLPPNKPPWSIHIVDDDSCRGDKNFYAIFWLHNSLSNILTMKDLIKVNEDAEWSKKRKTPSFQNPLSHTEVLVDMLLSSALVTINNLLVITKRIHKNLIKDPESFWGHVICFVVNVLMDIRSCCIQEAVDKASQTENQASTLEVALNLPLVIVSSLYKHHPLLRMALSVALCKIMSVSVWRILQWGMEFYGAAVRFALDLVKWTFSSLVLRRSKSLREKITDTLLYQAVSELMSIAWTVILTPYLILQEVSHKSQLNGLQRHGLCGQRLALISQEISMDTVDTIRHRTESSISHILLAGITLSLQNYFRDAGECVPDNLLCSLPIYRNDFADIQEGQPSGFLTVSLPTGLKDTTDIVTKIKSRLEKIKSYRFKFLLTMWLYEHIASFCPTLVVRFFLQWFTRKYPILITNMIGPQEHFRVWGYLCDDMNYWTPTLGDRKMSVTTITYCGKLHVNTLIDENFVSRCDSVRNSVIRNIRIIATNFGIKVEGNSPHSSPRSSPKETPSSSPKLSRRFLLS